MGKKIVVIDDDRVTRTMLEMIFSRHKYQVFSASDGEEGLELVKKEKPDIVISDMLIPKIHGLELCEKIKQDPDLIPTKVILMTAVYKSTAFKFEAKDSGAEDFIEKPIDANALLKKIDTLLKGSSKEDNSESES